MKGLNLGISIFCFITMVYHLLITNEIFWAITTGLLGILNMCFHFVEIDKKEKQ